VHRSEYQMAENVLVVNIVIGNRGGMIILAYVEGLAVLVEAWQLKQNSPNYVQRSAKMMMVILHDLHGVGCSVVKCRYVSLV